MIFICVWSGTCFFTEFVFRRESRCEFENHYHRLIRNEYEFWMRKFRGEKFLLEKGTILILNNTDSNTDNNDNDYHDGCDDNENDNNSTSNNIHFNNNNNINKHIANE